MFGVGTFCSQVQFGKDFFFISFFMNLITITFVIFFTLSDLFGIMNLMLILTL